MDEKRLLVVDDQPELGDMVQRVAEGLGYDTRVTVHAADFMETYRSFEPTVVVLDIVMPDIDGIELVQWLNEQNTTAKVFVTTAFNPHYAKMAETLGEAQGMDITIIAKPFRISELRNVLT